MMKKAKWHSRTGALDADWMYAEDWPSLPVIAGTIKKSGGLWIAYVRANLLLRSSVRERKAFDRLKDAKRWVERRVYARP